MKWWDWDSEEVLKENDVTIEWSDEVIDGNGNISKGPWGGSWSLCWKEGFIHLGVFGKEYEEIARVGAAIFITLWLKGVPAHMADTFAGNYVYLEWMRKQRKARTFNDGGGI